jgi:hypothetical protein
MTGFNSKRKIALDRLDDDDVQVYAQPAQRKYVHKERTETGIAMPYHKVNPSTPFNPAGTFVELPITLIEPPTLWQRVVRFFKEKNT